MSGNQQKYGWALSWKVEAFWFLNVWCCFISITIWFYVLVNGNIFLVNGNMFCVNGKLFLVNGKPFINKFHISCGFLKYAWCIFTATSVRNNFPH